MQEDVFVCEAIGLIIYKKKKEGTKKGLCIKTCNFVGSTHSSSGVASHYPKIQVGTNWWTCWTGPLVR